MLLRIYDVLLKINNGANWLDSGGSNSGRIIIPFTAGLACEGCEQTGDYIP